MNSVVAIIGDGVLADLVQEELSGSTWIARQTDFKLGVPEDAGMILVLHDAWHPSIHREAEWRIIDVPWLRGFVSFGEGIIGPFHRSGTSGCSRCADFRFLMGGSERKEMWLMQRKQEAEVGTCADAWASRTGLWHMAQLLVAEVKKELTGVRSILWEHMILTNMKTLQSSKHFFLPDPMCPVCGQLPDDSAPSAEIVLQPSLKINTDSYRCRSLTNMQEPLVKDYLDTRTGFLNGSMRDLLSPFADASVNLPLLSGDEGCAGRTHSYAVSSSTAILEGLERYCGMMPRGKRTIIHDSYYHLERQALNPVRVGLYSKEQYESPGFPFRPFAPEVPIDWVWGYSLLQERPVLVPESLAYYSISCGHGFVHETSNGCALGGSLEEAIFYGILEVIERDSFLMTWYGQLTLPRIDPSSSNDCELLLMLERMRTVAGYDVHLFDSTMEHGIPSVWAIAKSRKREGVNLVCAAGAHPDPIRAAKSSIHELAGMLLLPDDKFKSNRTDYLKMLQDPFLVRKMEDHSLLYSLPEAEERLSFLLDQHQPLRAFHKLNETRENHLDLTEDLRDILRALRKLQMEVIVIDQTTPEARRNELHCVKVIIPGMLPMTFGYHLTRLDGLERVFNVPMALGYTDLPLTGNQLNPHPHPFP